MKMKMKNVNSNNNATLLISMRVKLPLVMLNFCHLVCRHPFIFIYLFNTFLLYKLMSAFLKCVNTSFYIIIILNYKFQKKSVYIYFFKSFNIYIYI